VSDLGFDLFVRGSNRSSEKNDLERSYELDVKSKGIGSPLRKNRQADNQRRKAPQKKSSNGFYDTALCILYTLTPAILILDGHRRLVFANRDAEKLLEWGDVIALDPKGKVYCTDEVAQQFLMQYLMSYKKSETSSGAIDDGSFVIPKADGWPMIAMVGHDQLESLVSTEFDTDTSDYITLLIRDPNGSHPAQTQKLMEYFGLSQAETCVVEQLVNGESTDKIARNRGVSVVTIRNQLKSAQSKLGVARQSELVSMLLRYFS
jgi:DNA-binding CsgD family transcriptional regulator